MRKTFISSGLFGRGDDPSLTENSTPARDVDEINGDSDPAKLLRMSGQVDANEFTIQGAHGPQSSEYIEKARKEYEDKRRAFIEAVSNPFMSECLAAFLSVTRHYHHGLSPADVAAADQQAEQSLADQFKIEEIKVSDEAHAVIVEETKTLEEYIAEYEAATDPKERARIEMELRTFAKYLDVELDFDAEDGPSILGYHERRINKLEEYFHGDNPVPADKCHSQVCVLRDISHAHTGGRRMGVNVGDQYDQKPQEAIASGDHLKGEPPPALHIH